MRALAGDDVEVDRRRAAWCEQTPWPLLMPVGEGAATVLVQYAVEAARTRSTTSSASWVVSVSQVVRQDRPASPARRDNSALGGDPVRRSNGLATFTSRGRL
jgi:hypothetical protein